MMMSTSPWALRAVRGGGALLLAVLLAACGGGTEQIDAFDPRRLLVLGDEMSVLTKDAPQGRRYAVNGVQSDGVTLDCTELPVWHQRVASSFDFAYEECNPDNLAVTAARVYAEPGAKLDDLPAQLERARLVNGEFNGRDLFTVLVGMNDVIDLFERVYLPDPSEANFNAVLSELQARGTRLGRFVNSLTRLDVDGPKVIVSTIPRINQTPYARTQAAAYPEADVINVLSQFSQAYNTAMRVTIVNDGRFIGLVELDAIINFGFNDPVAYGLTNTLFPVCAVDPPDCYNTAASLVPGGDADSWLWASDKWMGTEAHRRLGNFARARARDNPF
jgi:outer membrane lipase/esterase